MSYSSKRKHDPFISKLIEEVKNHECLWNVQKKEFNSRGLMGRAWVDISSKMGTKIPILRAKWKNLKDAYRKELRKHVVDGEYRGVWLYYDKMSFMGDVVDLGDKNESETIEGFTLDDSLSLPDEDATMSYVSVSENNSQRGVKRQRDDYEMNTMFVQSNGDFELNPKMNAVDGEEMYDEQFLTSLLPFFRRLDPIRKLMIRSKIQAAVVEELTQSNRDPIGN